MKFCCILAYSAVSLPEVSAGLSVGDTAGLAVGDVEGVSFAGALIGTTFIWVAAKSVSATIVSVICATCSAVYPSAGAGTASVTP